MDCKLPLTIIEASGLGCLVGIIAGLILWGVKYFSGEDKLLIGDYPHYNIPEFDVASQGFHSSNRLVGVRIFLIGIGLLVLNHVVIIFQIGLYPELISFGSLFACFGLCVIIYPEIISRWFQSNYVPWAIFLWHMIICLITILLVMWIRFDVYGIKR